MTERGRWRAADGSAENHALREPHPFGSGVSGVRPATRVPAANEVESTLASALVEASRGRVVQALAGGEGENLAEFATALPELFGAPSLAKTLSLGRTESFTAGCLQDLVLVSPSRVHVAQRLSRDPELAVVSVAPRGPSLGFILSEARAALNRT